MLRSLVLILLLVNAAFYAWSQGWLSEVVGVKPDAQHEPQRLAQQVKAERITVVPPPSPDTPAPQPTASPEPALSETPAEAAASPASEGSPPETAAPGSSAAVASASTTEAATREASSPPPSPTKSGKTLCVEAGPFTAAEYASAETMLRPIVPGGIWTRQQVAIQGMWLVYMGPYADAEQLARKQDELRRIKGLDFEVVRTPPNLAQGISLGRFSKRDNADNQLEMLRTRGIRTARIVTLRQPMELQLLRVPRADVDTQVKLAGLKLPQGKEFTACRP
ncbi:MAG: hypothetical protein QM742_14030 [Aquabacterium sp.]